jgi:hypothetical protein
LPKVEYQPPSDEPPLVAAMRAYWTRKRGERALPRRQDIVPAEIKEWLPSVLLVDAIEGGADFRYRLVGLRLHQFFPTVPTGKLMTEALTPFGKDTIEITLKTYRSVMTLREPLRIKGDGAWYGQEPKYFEAILTPLSDDGVNVNMIFGAFDFMWDLAGLKLPEESLDERAWNAAMAPLR